MWSIWVRNKAFMNVRSTCHGYLCLLKCCVGSFRWSSNLGGCLQYDDWPTTIDCKVGVFPFPINYCAVADSTDNGISVGGRDRACSCCGCGWSYGTEHVCVASVDVLVCVSRVDSVICIHQGRCS